MCAPNSPQAGVVADVASDDAPATAIADEDVAAASSVETPRPTRDAEECWWAMSAVYNRSMKVKAALDAASVRCFVPMRWEERSAGRRKVRRRVPAVHNLLFVRTDVAGIRALKESFPYLQYLMRREEGCATPVVVPEEQMRHFIAVAGSDDERTLFVPAAHDGLRCGDRVRICGGAFAGVEGRLMKMRGTRNRRVVVAIDGVAAVATAAVAPELIEPIG